jgi:hypothetical protein
LARLNPKNRNAAAFGYCDWFRPRPLIPAN